MQETFTEGAIRALERAEKRARHRDAEAVEPTDLLAALVDEPESRAAEILAQFGLEPSQVWSALGVAAPLTEPEEPEPAGDVLPQSPAFRTAMSDAKYQARAFDRARLVGTEHLLAGLVAAPGPAADLVAGAGIELENLLRHLSPESAVETSPLPLDTEIPPLELTEPGQGVDLGRILDASANRAREGLRVVEDYVRFALDDSGLTRRIKDVRHRLAAAVQGLDLDTLIGSRDTRGDVGTHIMTASEQARENPRAVLTANFKRTAEALRTLEEYTKLIDVWLSGRFEVLRYDVYTLEKLTLTAAGSKRSLGEARLMVLVGGLPTLGDLTWVVGEALAGGADLIQLREKDLPDREWLQRAREVRILTAQARARFILNDRPDLARLAGADGVHLGQDDVTLRDARRIVGPLSLIGVSTHDRPQLEQAILAGAGYLGVGPVFSSTTKDFSDLAGLAFVRQAAETTTLPWYAIGGIHEENIEQVLEAGASRVAVSSAVVRAPSPRRAAAALRARLEAVGSNLASDLP
ncbi:thiamine phosphate synthase [Singulisphaera acidiphila]|uniref:Thiamine-phosphate synthase n=1 Tax=Singulisphaera acidiphila (strain ATCC BAA-1392 / DSM 18658 / VKM B-2454 / MOB10) TaxID=886293 RepID=L0DJY7_SINAD|nr:thiamine phosphate synthase [Singulisphaera acidiphila]AGA28951.1 thiamine-phosphate pyrophosphorylase [Singulisphaera acidiphila DSM 18658]